jgi:hypothetical protein
VLYYFPGEEVGEWVREPRAVYDVHLFLLQFHAGRFVASWQGEMALLFSVQHSIGRLSMG